MEWTGLKFSPDGKTILLSTNGGVIRLVDAFHGNPTHSLTVNDNLFTNFKKLHSIHFYDLFPKGHVNDKKLALEASFSPDSQFVFSGSSDGKVHAWNAETGHRVNYFLILLDGIHFSSRFLFVRFAHILRIILDQCSVFNSIPNT